MGSPSEASPFVIVFALVALSLVLVAIGFILRRSGALASPGAALGWAVLCIAPLFGAGALLFSKHQVDEATGVTEPGVHGNALAPHNR